MTAASPTVDPENASEVLLALGRALMREDFRKIDVSSCLHKDVAGSLVACASLGEMMRHEIAHGCSSEKLELLLGSLDSAIRQALQVVRELSEGLFPPVLKAFGLNVALQQLVRGITENFTGSLVLHINGDETKLDLATRLNLFHIIQSLLTRCVQQDETSWIEVTSRSTPERMEITVDHNGGHDVWTEEADGGEMALVQARCLVPGVTMEMEPTGPVGTSRISLVAQAVTSAAQV
ncbi:MAG TPA: hypothetical protein VGE39_16300 [Prosthecobacter sp.]